MQKEYIVDIITPDNKTHSLRVKEDEDILDRALDAGLELPYNCLQGWCLSCAVKIISGRINQKDSRRFFEEDRRSGFGLICTGKPESDLIIKTNARDEMKASRSRNNLPFPRGSWGE